MLLTQYLNSNIDMYLFVKLATTASFEPKQIQERGQKKITQSVSTSHPVSTSMIIAATLITTGVFLFIVGLFMILVYYFVNRQKKKISAEDPESGYVSNISIDMSNMR